jgi:hypothetical protein
MPLIPITSLPFVWSPAKYLLSENRKALHYAFFSSLLLLLTSYAQTTINIRGNTKNITNMAVRLAAMLLGARKVQCGSQVPDIYTRRSWYSSVSPNKFRSALNLDTDISFISRLIHFPYHKVLDAFGSSHCISYRGSGGITSLVLNTDTRTSEWSASQPLYPAGEDPWRLFQ